MLVWQYKRIKHRGVSSVTAAVWRSPRLRVRRERMGHIELAVPVTHIWFFKCMPSRIGLVLDVTARNLERVIYYEDYLVVDPGDTPLEKNPAAHRDGVPRCPGHLRPGRFVAKMGAEAVHDAAALIDLEAGVDQLQQAMTETRSKQIRKKLAKRIKVYQGFIKSKSRPEWMVLTVLPVIPPDLRPLVPLEGGRFATIRPERSLSTGDQPEQPIEESSGSKTPEVMSETRSACCRRQWTRCSTTVAGRAVTGAGNRPSSLERYAQGQERSFPPKLLGKRVDYSGRSVIVIGPDLKLHQCGLPKKMALGFS